MRAVVIGATGTIGSAVVEALQAGGHEVVQASRKGEVKVDIADPGSIEAMYEQLGKVDAVVCCAGDAAFKPLAELAEEDLRLSIDSKLLGQVNLVRLGLDHVSDGGVFVLTAGIFSRNPWPGVPAIAMANGALESFARAAALDAPRSIRINAVSPPFITESAEKMGLPAEGTLSAAENAKAYLALIDGSESGAVIFPSDLH